MLGRIVEVEADGQARFVGLLACVTICVTTSPLTSGRFGMIQDPRPAR